MRLCLSCVAVLLLIPVAAGVSGCNTAPPLQAPSTSEVPAAVPALSQVERGKKLIIGGGCHDCHTPKKLGPNGPEADMDRMLSGSPRERGCAGAIQANQGQPLCDTHQRSPDCVERAIGAYRLPRI